MAKIATRQHSWVADATFSLTGVESRFFDRLPQLGGAYQRRVTGDAGLPRSEGYFHLLDAGQRLEGSGNTLHATLATHPGYCNHDSFHQTFPIREPGAMPYLSPARQRLRSSELDTTETELIAMAAPAITGLSIPSAARGMPSTL